MENLTTYTDGFIRVYFRDSRAVQGLGLFVVFGDVSWAILLHGFDLVACHARFDCFRPSVDAAGNIRNSGVIVGAKILGYPQAAAAMVAENENMFVVGQLGQPAGNLAHGNL